MCGPLPSPEQRPCLALTQVPNTPKESHLLHKQHHHFPLSTFLNKDTEQYKRNLYRKQSADILLMDTIKSENTLLRNVFTNAKRRRGKSH